MKPNCKMVLINLIKNAMDALEHTDKPFIHGKRTLLGNAQQIVHRN